MNGQACLDTGLSSSNAASGGPGCRGGGACEGPAEASGVTRHPLQPAQPKAGGIRRGCIQGYTGSSVSSACHQDSEGQPDPGVWRRFWKGRLWPLRALGAIPRELWGSFHLWGGPPIIGPQGFKLKVKGSFLADTLRVQTEGRASRHPTPCPHVEGPALGGAPGFCPPPGTRHGSPTAGLGPLSSSAHRHQYSPLSRRGLSSHGGRGCWQDRLWGEGQAAQVAAERKPRCPARLLSVVKLRYPPPTLPFRPRLGHRRLQTVTEMSRRSGSRIRHGPGPMQASGNPGGERG